jgi:hypothetical protein
MFNSEALHRGIDLAEEIHGLAGQTQEFLIEKRRRDARVLTIYEGTNEIQRFFILRDLVNELAPRRAKLAPPPTSQLSGAAAELESVRVGLWERIDGAVSTFGQGLWQNPNLQPDGFVLSEAIAWYKAADSTLGRLAWLVQQRKTEGQETGQRALARCLAEVKQRLQQFDRALEGLKRGFYHPAIRAAELLFDAASQPQRRQPVERAFLRNAVKQLNVLVIIEPTLAGVPRPHVEGGRLLEAYRELSAADRSALEIALRLRDQANVKLHVAAVGWPLLGHVLRQILALEVAEAHLVIAEGEAPSPAACAAALAEVLAPLGPFDFILSGDDGRAEEGLIGRLTAATLGVQAAGQAADVTLGNEGVQLSDAEGGSARLRSLPTFVAIEAALPLRSFTTTGFLAGLARPLRTYPWPAHVPAALATLDASSAAPPTTGQEPRPLSPTEAAATIRGSLGVERSSSTTAFAGAIEEVTGLSDAQLGVVAVLACDCDGQLGPGAAAVLQAAALAVERAGTSRLALLLVPPEERVQRRAVVGVLNQWQGSLLLLVVPDAALPLAAYSQLFTECWPQLGLSPRVVIGESWAEDAFARHRLIGRVQRLAQAGSYLLVETRRAAGRLLARRLLPMPPTDPCWICLAPDAEVDAGKIVAATVRVQRWKPRLERFYGREEIRRLLEELKQETGLVRLTDAELIVDVGFGVGNRDGFEAVIEPLEKALREAGARSLVVGGSRKVTEELRLLPVDRQIGQSGMSVRPRLLLAIGISGAPQHLNYIGPEATIVAFNRDPEAPIMTLNQRQAKPRVFPVIGDLFVTVPALTAALRNGAV